MAAAEAAAASDLGMQTPAEALAGSTALPEVGNHKKTARIQADGGNASNGGENTDTERMRSKRGSIGVTKLNETRAKRAAANHAREQQACHFSCFNSPLATSP